MFNLQTKLSLRALKPSDPIERRKAFAVIQKAIKAGDMEKAHRTLFTLVESDSKTPEFWLLMAWTAPDRLAAETFFKHLVRRYPDFPDAIGDVKWSGKEWGLPAEARQTGSRDVERILEEDRDTDRGQVDTSFPAEGLATSTEPMTPQSLSASGTSTPVSSREARWWAGAAPGSGSAAVDGLSASASSTTISGGLVKGLREELLVDGGASGDLPRPRMLRLSDRLGRLKLTTTLALYMLGITLAELVTTFIKPQLGLVIHGVLLVLLLIHSSILTDRRQGKFLLALGLAPLIRLMSLSMPLLQFDFIYWYMIIGIPLLVATVVVYRLNGYKPGQIGLGLGKLLPVQLVIGLGGLGLGFLEYMILKPQPLVESFSLQSIWLPALILLVFTGFLEELIFRGLMQRASAVPLEKYGLLYISLLFAVLHIGYKSWLDLIFVFLVGFAFSIVVERTRSLVGVTLAHGLTNISLFLVFPFLVGTQLQLPDYLPPPQEQVIGPAIWSAPQLMPRVTRLPQPTITSTPTLQLPTATLVAEPLPGAEATPTLFSLPTNTPTSSPIPSPTRRFTATPTVVYTATPTPSPTSTPTPLPTASSTPTDTSTPTPTPTGTLIPTDVLPEEPTVIPTEFLPPEPNLYP